ncbi:TonB-dependent receptor [Parapedomonas caeni]
MTTTDKKRKWGVSILALTTAVTGFGEVALAQDTATAASGSNTVDFGEIVVTARRRDESIQNVPIAITAMTAEDLANRNISNLNDLTNTTPGVAITSIAGGTMQMIYIRGQSPANTTNDLNVEANVGVFIDDIYQTSRNTLDMISVLDVGQIEIAKGPQSALFGRSTFAGAMSISTRRAANEFEGNVQATVGTDEDFRIRGSISTPLSETLTARISAGYLTYDGYGKNAANTSDNLGGTEKYAVTASLEFAPTPEFSARLAAFITSSKTEPSAVSLMPLANFNCGTTNAATGLQTQYCGELEAQKVSDITPEIPRTSAKTRQVSLKMNWSGEDVAITSISGIAGAENWTYNDYDGTSGGTLFGVCTLGASCSPAGAYERLVRVNLLTSNRERVRTFSQEFRLQSNNDSPFQWMLGANYFMSKVPLTAIGIATDASELAANERLVQVSQITTPAATGTGAYDFTANPYLASDPIYGQTFSSYTDAQTQTTSMFAALGYDFGGLRVNAEGRYNVDRKRARVNSVSNPLSQPGVNLPIDGTHVPDEGYFPVNGTPYKRKFTSFTPRFTIDYKVTPDVFLFASAAKGVRSGGFNTGNPVSATGILADEVSYDEEENWTYELGVKSEWLDRRLLINASVFHVDWTNAQVSAFTQNPTAVNPVRIVRNAGNIKTDGFEIQTRFRATDIFSFGGSVVYSDPKFKAGAYDGSIVTQCVIGSGETATAAPGCPDIVLVTLPNGTVRALPSLEGKRPARSVKLQWNLHAIADVPLNDDWHLMGRVDVSYTGPTYYNLINTGEFGERTLTNVRVALESDRYSIALWANNLFNKTYVGNAIAQPRSGVPFTFSVPEIYLGEKRRVGLTAGVKF